VLAMRVVEPGNMGLPRVLAVGLSDSPGLLARLSPPLELLAPDLSELWLLRVIEEQQRFSGVLSHPRLEQLRTEALADLERTGRSLATSLAAGQGGPARLERQVDFGEQWADRLASGAHRVRAHLLLLGASDHLLPSRFTLSNPLEIVLRDAACDVAVFRAGGA
ncbi:MAG: universal stress protein, partial [Myxococcales bacterium]|nr:universal stress protein [Myxococcales bacterium]